ncbi:hypothetical protein AgCh_021895 [Apium graveolens]
MHIDDANYNRASVGVTVSDSDIGPFEYLYSKQPHGFDSRDMAVFKDGNDMPPLSPNYLDVTHVVIRALVGQRREAPTLFKHEETYYMITSGM